MIRSAEFDAPIERQSVAEKVVHRIISMVQSGALKAGDQLPTERDLAMSMQLSRPSVREAIRALTVLGVVRTRQGGGVYISDLDANSLLEPLHFFITLDSAHVDELQDVRIMIEGGVARQAALNISDDALARLRAMLAPQKALIEDPVGFRVSDAAFHGLIWEGAGNRFLNRVAHSLFVLGMDYRRIASESPGVLDQSYRDHVAIVEALEAHDPGRAEAASTVHMENVRRTTLAAMRQTS